jgi:hypothetical protein
MQAPAYPALSVTLACCALAFYGCKAGAPQPALSRQTYTVTTTDIAKISWSEDPNQP